MMGIRKIAIYTLLILGCVLGCKDDESLDAAENNFDVTALLTDVTNNEILVSVIDFNNEAEHLNTIIETYLDDINEENLIQVRNQWKIAALSYARAYGFNIGQIRDQFFHQGLYNWPTLPNAIESFINNNEVINEQVVTTFSPQVKTLSAIEYLIFKADNITVNKEFEVSENRRNYLRLIAVELSDRAIRLVDTWQESGENYADTFINSDETGIDNSFNLLYNGLFNLIDTGKVTKIGKPAGLENSVNINPELTQAYFSDSSLDILRINIESVAGVYFAPQGLGIADYVFSIMGNDELNNAIASKLEEVYGSIDAIPVPLFQAISDYPDEVAELHQKLSELGVLFSVDVRSVLSIIITSTDNDGD